LVGETRAERGKKRRKRTLSTISQVLNPVDHDVEIEGEGSASEAEGVIISDDEGWTDPVTRAPVDKKLDVPSDDEFSASSMYSQDGKNREVSVPRDDLTPSKRAVEPGFTFRLRSAEKRNSLLSLDTNSQSLVEEKDAATLAQTPIKSSQPYKPSPSPTSILSNPIPSIVTHDANNTTPPGKATRQNRLLPNPMSTSLLDPSVPATPASRTFAAAISNSSSGRSLAAPPRLHHTPFHLRKTLILDLDETLIHSTSRPLSYAASAGGGLLGLSFGGLLGGRGKRREGHTVEVVIGGRSTTYHVYKRPYVDHFLKKVRGDRGAELDLWY
jgi:CTD nuclear envelope phosphatase 1